MKVEEGSLLKCPACGMTIDIYTTVCPACGTPIVGTAATDSSEAQAFAQELLTADSNIAKISSASSLIESIPWPENNWLKVGWVLLNIGLVGFPIAFCILIPFLGKGDFNQPEKQKVQLIKNKSFSTRASYVEATRIAGEQLMMLATERFSSNTAAWAKIWKAKADEFYKNGQRHEGDNKTLGQYYENVLSAYKKIQRKVHLVFGIIVVWAVIALLVLFNSASDSEEERSTRMTPTPTTASSKGANTTGENVLGTYVGETGSVIVVHQNGKATYYWYGWDDLKEDNKWNIDGGKINISLPSVGCEVSADIVEPNNETVFASKSMNWDDEKFVRIDANDTNRTTEECDSLLKQYFGDKAEKAVERVRSSSTVSYTCDNVKFLFPKGVELTDSKDGKEVAISKELKLTIGEGKDTITDEAFLKNGETIIDNLFNRLGKKGKKNQYGQYEVASYKCIAADYTFVEESYSIKIYVINEPERGKYVWVVAIATRRDLFAEVDTMLKMALKADGETTKASFENVEIGNVSSSVKTLLDKYEAFVDRYVSFMTKYNKASNPLSMYKEYMELEVEMLKWTNEVDNLQIKATGNDALYTLLVVYKSLSKLENVMR